ncbi:hepatic lectin-like [Trichomycterus rosablanca]|uniref:hepatic lectin-like n=1 Tax=Trichomycterus rosablanca TaxID=2290929 RepID=UPI002F3500A1
MAHLTWAQISVPRRRSPRIWELLRVKLNNVTTEKDQLQISCYNLTEERDRLQKRLSEMVVYKYHCMKGSDIFRAGGFSVKNRMDINDSVYSNTEETVDYSSELNDTNDLWKNPWNKKYQKLRSSGGIRFRVTVLCLLLLSVLLLIAVGVLWVKLNNVTTEKDQLQNSCYNLTEERDKLQKRLFEMENRENQGRYFVTHEMKGWHEARKDCLNENADLVIINSQEKQEYITKKFPGVEAWIGLIDIEIENDWKWVDGTPLTTEFWWTGEPNDWSNNEDCVVINSKFAKSPVSTWADYPCHFPVRGLCEKKQKPNK